MNRRGITLATLAIMITVMIILAAVGGSVAVDLIRKGNKQRLVSEMLLIQTKVKIIMEKASFSGDTSIYVGTKLKDDANKVAIANGVLSSEELEADSIYIYDQATLDSIGLNGIELPEDAVFLVDYNNSDIIYPRGCKIEDGSVFYRLSEMYGNLATSYQAYIQVVSFSAGKDYIDAEAFISDVRNEIVAYQFNIGKTEEEARNYAGAWQDGSTYRFEELEGSTNYYIIAKIKDVSGNEQESQVYRVRTEVVVEQTEDASGANIPKVPTGANVQYVTWTATTADGVTTWEEKLNRTKPEVWHNYNEKEWANIKTTSNDGTNEAYWVWIPRYAYQVPARPTSTSNEGGPEFQIVFLEGNTNNPVDSTFTETILPNTTASVSTGDWVVHPAFKFGDTQLEGIWVAKYEASSNAPNTVADGGGNIPTYQVNVKPSVPSWRSITATNMFDVCQNMTASTGALEGASSSDPHMMKNVEWGAVVYLAQSKYGKNGQVWNNPYYQSLSTAWDDTNVSVSGNDVILTGKASSTADSPNATTTTACDSYNTGNGPEASTTGNVYGVYDMAGGSYEYTAAYVNNSNAQSSSYITSLRTAVGNTATAKYVDLYDASDANTAQANYEANASKYGDSVYETSYQGTGYTSWQKDYSYFPNSSSPVFWRGGYCSNGDIAGVFYFYSYGGYSGSYYGFRPVCLAL